MEQGRRGSGQGSPMKKRKAKRATSPGTVDMTMNSPLSHRYPPALRTPRVIKPRVMVRVVVLKLGEIETKKETFKAEVFLQARWREPALDHCHNVEDIQWDALWNPQLHLDNAEGDGGAQVWRDVLVNDQGEAFVVEKRRQTSIFTETMELQSYPFDVQHLSVHVTSRLSEQTIDLVEDPSEVCSVNMSTFGDANEWLVRDVVDVEEMSQAREFSSAKHKVPVLKARLYAQRRIGYFVWNILAIMVLISSMVLCIFAVDRTLPQNRLGLGFTLFLTGIAFKFSVGQALPKLSYLTILDKYILGCMVIMFLVNIWNAMLTRAENNASLANDLDKYAFVVIALLFAIYNIVFGLYIIIKVYSSRKELSNLEVRYKAKVDELTSKQAQREPQSSRSKKNQFSNSRVEAMA